MRQRYISGSVANPAAGVDLSDIINYGDSFELLTLRAKLTTSATVASRVAHFQFIDLSGDVLHEVLYTTQAASTAYTYDLCAGNGAMAAGLGVIDNVAQMPLPDFWVPAGTKIATVTTNLQSADQWSGIFFTALVGEQWENLRLLELISQQQGD